MTNTKQNSSNQKSVPVNESGTRVHSTPSATSIGVKQPPKSK